MHFIIVHMPYAVLMSCLLLSGVQAGEGSMPRTIRIATYNASLFAKTAGSVAARLRSGTDAQAQSISAIVQTVRPDILLMNEIDHDVDAATVKWLRDLYFAVPMGDRPEIEYPYIYSASSNTGVDSGLDLNRNGRRREPNDAWGYGTYPGQYAFAVMSRFPLDLDAIRTFQKFDWAQLPGALRPVTAGTQVPFHTDEVWRALRLSSKNHVDIPVLVEGRVLHLLASHPTPPVFDGPEDLNGCRNHDEIRFWQHYIDDQASLVDDLGRPGGLGQDELFVIMGDLNSDPDVGESRPEAIRALLGHHRVFDPRPSRKLGVNDLKGAAHSTASFRSDETLRVDYLLPSASIRVTKAEVFWPADGETGSDWIRASDHRMVWIDAILPAVTSHQ